MPALMSHHTFGWSLLEYIGPSPIRSLPLYGIRGLLEMHMFIEGDVKTYQSTHLYDCAEYDERYRLA